MNTNVEIIFIGIVVNFILLLALRGIYKHGAAFVKGFVGSDVVQVVVSGRQRMENSWIL